MEKEIEFSFLMAVYNEEKLIGSALDNITDRINESGAKSEILVSIKGKDRTREIVRSYAKKFKRINIYVFNQTRSKSGTIDQLTGRARGDIIINFDTDKLLTTSLKNIRAAFENSDVGGIVSMDSLDPKLYFNDGQRLFEKTYDEIKLKKYLKGDSITNPIFCCFIFRKSALKKPYIESYGDDFEITWKLLKAKRKVIFSKKLSYALIDNPTTPKITAESIIKRRFRAEVFRGQTKSLKIEEFNISSRFMEFAHAILLTIKRANMRERAQFLHYIGLVVYAMCLAKLRIAFQGNVDKRYANAASIRN